MQKDETFLLRPWLAYYGWLFGFDNLYVIDNGSERPDVRATLEEFEEAGVHVNRKRASREAYRAKGAVVSAVIREIQKTRQYDFIMPLDCDEFIALKTELGYSVDREAILAYLATLVDEAAVLRFPFQLANHPLTRDIYHYYHMPKIFFAGGTFGWVDHGHHNGRSLKSDEIVDTRLIQLHFHFKRFDTFIQQARQTWIGFVSVDDKEGMRNYNGPSKHVSSYFTKDRETYYQEFLQQAYFYIPELSQILKSLGAPLNLPDDTIPPELRIRFAQTPPAHGSGPLGAVVVFPDRSSATGEFTVGEFQEKRYMELNSQLAAANVEPMRHFLHSGFKEGRRLK